jgi:hypothetical protein
VTAYEVYRDGTLLGTPSTPSYKVSGLLNGTTYNMTVRAKDAAGNWSALNSPAYPVTFQFDPAGDYDGDGVSNGLELSLGLDPENSGDVRVFTYSYDKNGQLKRGPGNGATGEYIKDAEGNITQVLN